MNRKASTLILVSILMVGSSAVMACDFKVGETKYVDYANCRHGSENILVIELPGNSNWDECIYYVEAFRPGKLLAVTKVENDREVLSINDRSKIGNPCYLTKSSCDTALRAFEQALY